MSDFMKSWQRHCNEAMCIFLEKNNKFEKGEYEQLLPGAIRILCKPDERARMIFVDKTSLSKMYLDKMSNSSIPNIFKDDATVFKLFLYTNN
jgi:uncharacterized protein YfaT (DUF1175 family)